MKHVLLFGAGKSATVLIDYLLENAPSQQWQLTLVDADHHLAQSKIGSSAHGKAVSFDIFNEDERARHIQGADIVISLMPPTLHLVIAKDCIRYRKDLLTASYVDDSMRALKEDIEKNGLLFLCEMGLDPGIDHMSAKKLIDHIHHEGGVITSFLSHCGGLVAPESDDNPWHYKISWNPRNVVMAGKAGAIFKKDGATVELSYRQLFDEQRFVTVPGGDAFCWYPNRDSLSYIPVYGLESCSTFVRTTLRHPDFIGGWKTVIELELIGEEKKYDTEGRSLAQAFEDILGGNVIKDLPVAQQQQLLFLGLNDEKTLVDKGVCSAADILQLSLEKNLALKPGDRDMIVMLHEIGYELNGESFQATSALVLEGRDDQHTAMATTVGLPLGIAARLILNGTIQTKGLHIPIIPEIYNPVLEELDARGIRFHEVVSPKNP
jgi:saccharopine dehydrogenase-like NADP-dependent oxidoreductase